MKAFFVGFNFVRATILFSLIGSCVLGWMAWERNAERVELKAALDKDGRVEKLCRDIQSYSQEYSQLATEANSEGIKGQDSPRSYITKIAGMDRVELGDVETSKRTQPYSKDVVDEVFTVKPLRENFLRTRLANFFYSLENESRRVRVTNLKIQVADKTNPGEVPGDHWTFDCQVTSRKKLEE